MRTVIALILLASAAFARADSFAPITDNNDAGLMVGRIDVTSTGTSFLLVAEVQPTGQSMTATTTTLTLVANTDNPAITGSTFLFKDYSLDGGGFLTLKLVPVWGAKKQQPHILWTANVLGDAALLPRIDPPTFVQAFRRIGNAQGLTNNQINVALQIVAAAAHATRKAQLQQQTGLVVQ